MTEHQKKQKMPYKKTRFLEQKEPYNSPPEQNIFANSNRPAWLYLPVEQANFVFFDLETTGGNPQNSSIREIGAIKYCQGKEVGRFDTLIRPKHHISSIVQKITGINNKMVENSPSFEDVADEFFNFIGDYPLVSHGAVGDISFLYHHYKEIHPGTELPNYHFCTHLIASHFFKELPSKTLSGIARYFGLPEVPAHKALNDAHMTCSIFFKMVELMEREGYRKCIDILKLQADKMTLKKLGPGINPGLANLIPPNPGIAFLTNSDQEISFLTATQNLKKAYHTLCTLSPNKDLNKAIVCAEGFKYERSNHFLDALLKEHKQIKKISLDIDPRLIQNRTDNFVQIFIPEDMAIFANKQSQEVPFMLPKQSHYQFDSVSEDYLPASPIYEGNEFLFQSEESTEAVVIKKTKQNKSDHKHENTRLTRDRKNSDSFIEYGYLKKGLGYYFGPFPEIKDIKNFIDNAVQHVPFYDKSLPMNVRFLYLKTLISYLNNSIQDEADYMQALFLKTRSLKNMLLWPTWYSVLKQINTLSKVPVVISKEQLPRSGVIVISNNELKELEVYVVVKGVILKKIHLPIEQGDKLKSVRYFTRMFEHDYHAIKEIHTPTLFTEDLCSRIELFNYWLVHKNDEGDWADFFELEPLFDLSVLQ